MRDKGKYLQIYLYVFGLASIFLIPTIPIIWGDILLWQPRNLPTEIMIAVIYMAMGVVMVRSAKAPLRHKSFIDFLILANLLHGAVMFVAAENTLQIIFDAIPIGLMGAIPFFVYPWEIRDFLKAQPTIE